MTRTSPALRNQMRARIAQLAARLMAEDGIQDFSQAKRKAARQLGAEDTHHLPNNAEIEAELRAYQSLYQSDEHTQRLHALRQQACEAMRLLARFNPYLTGSVLAGTATRHSDINLMLFADSEKEVELFLLNAQIEYERGEKRYRFGDATRAIPVLTLRYGGEAAIDVAIFATDDVRVGPRSPADARVLARARLAEVEAML